MRRPSSYAEFFARRRTRLPRKLIKSLYERNLTLAAAESCTGGLLGKLLTDVPGSSAVLLLSAVTYSNAAKQKLLGVTSELLEHHGAVSEACARAMAEGARRLAGADLAVSITGIAGPAGGSLTKPVGSVYLAVSDAAGTEIWPRSYKARDRRFIRILSAEAAMWLVLRRLGG